MPQKVQMQNQENYRPHCPQNLALSEILQNFSKTSTSQLTAKISQNKFFWLSDCWNTLPLQSAQSHVRGRISYVHSFHRVSDATNDSDLLLRENSIDNQRTNQVKNGWR